MTVGFLARTVCSRSFHSNRIKIRTFTFKNVICFHHSWEEWLCLRLLSCCEPLSANLQHIDGYLKIYLQNLFTQLRIQRSVSGAIVMNTDAVQWSEQHLMVDWNIDMNHGVGRPQLGRVTKMLNVLLLYMTCLRESWWCSYFFSKGGWECLSEDPVELLYTDWKTGNGYPTGHDSSEKTAR